MSWKNLTWFAIAVLIIINAVFAIIVFSDYRSNNYYDASSISEMIDLLAQSDITLDNKIFPSKRLSLPVFSASDSVNSFERAVSSLAGEDAVISDGECTFEKNGGTYTLSEDYKIRFADDSYEYIDKTAGEKVTDRSELRHVKKAAQSFVGEILSASGDSAAKAAASLSYVADDVYRVGDGIYSATIREYIDTYKTVNTIKITVASGKVVFAEGSMMFAPPTNTFSANNYELFGILIKEKRYFDSLESTSPMTVSSIEYVYDVCFDVFNNVYMIPACAITYTDGTVHIYDVVSSDIISE